MSENVIPLNSAKVSDEYEFIMRVQHSNMNGGEVQTLYRHIATGIGLIVWEADNKVIKMAIPPEMITLIKLRF